MTRVIRLRRWQKTALDRYLASQASDFLAVATPGSGKTAFALAAARHELAAGRRRLVVVAPTAHLKFQWARAAARFGVHLDPHWGSDDGAPARDMHGVVTTYQQVAAASEAVARLGRDAFAVFDEVHHAGDDRAWGAALRAAFEQAGRRLSLSGTPFRSDNHAIPFVRYEGDEATPDFEYGYGDALADGRVVRPIHFPRTNGQMEWSAPDGSLYSATFDDALDTVRANQRLRTALALEGQWLPEVLASADRQLEEIRRRHVDAGGLVIAMDQDHARGIARLLRDRHGAAVTVATSDDPHASRRISDFAESSDPWLVAVRMVSEGVDIPRLRVGVYATTTTTELFFRQAVGRFVRNLPGSGVQRAYLFIPDDVRLRVQAARIGEQRRHSLRRREDDADVLLEPMEAVPEREEPQLSLFAAISAVATDAHHPGPGDERDDEPREGEREQLGADSGEDTALVLELTPVPLPGRSANGGRPVLESQEPPSGLSRAEHKAQLRESNAQIARALARRAGWTHAKVNAELNRLSGVRRVTEATTEQLQTRLRHGERWLSRC